MDSLIAKTDDEDLLCGAGCMEVVDIMSSVALRECKHKFHFNCIMNWFQASKKSSCPLCRTTAEYFIKPSGEQLSIVLRADIDEDEFDEEGEDEDEEEEELECLICSDIILDEDEVVECNGCWGYAHSSCIPRRTRIDRDWFCRTCLLERFEGSPIEGARSNPRASSHSYTTSSTHSSRVEPRAIEADPIRVRIEVARASSSSDTSSCSSSIIDQTKLIEHEMVLARERMLGRNAFGSNIRNQTTAATAKKSKRRPSSFINEMENCVGNGDDYGYRTSRKRTKRDRNVDRIPAKYSNMMRKLRKCVDSQTFVERSEIASLLTELALCLDATCIRDMIKKGVIKLLGTLLRPIPSRALRSTFTEPAIRESALRTIDCYLAYTPQRYKDELKLLLNDYVSYKQKYPNQDHGRSCELAAKILKKCTIN